MHIKNLNEFKNICPIAALCLFIESARYGDFEIIADTLSEVERAEYNMGDENPIWNEFNTRMRELGALTFDYTQIETDLESLIAIMGTLPTQLTRSGD